MIIHGKNFTSADMVTDIGTISGDMQSHEQTQLNMDVLQITDYCPEWAFPEVSGS